MLAIGAGCRRILLLVSYDRYFCDPNLYSGRKFWIIPFKSSTIFGVVTKNYINNWEANLFVLFIFILQETLPGKDEEEEVDGEEEGDEGGEEGEEGGEGGEEGPDWDRAEFLSSQGCDLMYFFHPLFLQNFWRWAGAIMIPKMVIVKARRKNRKGMRKVRYRTQCAP
jgi:hypothetical protein